MGGRVGVPVGRAVRDGTGDGVARGGGLGVAGGLGLRLGLARRQAETIRNPNRMNRPRMINHVCLAARSPPDVPVSPLLVRISSNPFVVEILMAAACDVFHRL